MNAQPVCNIEKIPEMIIVVDRETQSVTDIDECEQLCCENDWCLSYNFVNGSQTTCDLNRGNSKFISY